MSSSRKPNRGPSLDTPSSGRRRFPRFGMGGDAFGVGAEKFARVMGTPQFLAGMTVFCAVWLLWNTLTPEPWQFDPRALNFTLLTLILSLQASYAAPLILLAENRSADRDRVEFQADRQRAERNLADTEFLTREIASLRIAMREVATRDFIRSELRGLIEEIEEQRQEERERAAADSSAGADSAVAGSDDAGADGADSDGADEDQAPRGGGTSTP